MSTFLILVIALVMLWQGADYLVGSACRIAHSFGLSELVVGLTIVSLGTSAPEFAVSVSAAVQGNSAISFTNVIGSDIFNLGLILGFCAMVTRVRTTREMVFRDGIFLLACSVLLFLFLMDYQLARWEGLAFLLLFAGYVAYLFVKPKTKAEIDAIVEEVDSHPMKKSDIPVFFISLTVIALGGQLLISSATEIARAMGISEWIIGMTIVAGGTSLPEFATSLIAAMRGKFGISAGNLLGSDIFNILGVLGLAALVNPLVLDSTARLSMVLLMGAVLLVVIFMRTRFELNRWEGAVLVGVSLFRWFLDIRQF